MKKNRPNFTICIDIRSKIIECSKELKIDYPILIAEADVVDTMKRLGNREGGLPVTVVLDPRRAVVHTCLGTFKQGELDRILDPLVG